MADINDLLQKQKERLESRSLQNRKKIVRTGPTRPWQEHLAQYQEARTQNKTEAKLEPNLSQTEAKLEPELRPQLEPSTSSSSSSLNIDLKKLTNTRTSEASEALPPEWTNVDISPLLPIRFGRTQLMQLVQLGKLEAVEVQDSIYAFAFDLEVNEKAKEINGAALNYFMGILRKGPYVAAVNYEPPDVRQRRLYVEAKERERKAREELNVRLESVEFDSWVARLSQEERVRIVPSSDFAKPGSQGHNVQLKEYFRESVWPELREKGNSA